MRYFKLLALFLKNSALREMEYRANFAAEMVLGFLYAAIAVVSVGVFYGQTDALGGWSLAEALVVVALFTLMNGVIHAVLEPNVQDLIAMVRDGKLDFVLVKPVNSQFISTLRRYRFSGASDLAAGAAILGIAFTQLDYAPSLQSLALFALMFGVAVLIVYSIWVVIATTSFWFVKVNNLSELFRAVYDTARFPVNTFPGMIRLVLTFVVPVAFITTFPAQAVLGRLDAPTVLAALAFGLALFAGSAGFWRYAIRNYSSASS